MAEGEGFEPSIRYNRMPDFESGAFDHSATLPCRDQREMKNISKHSLFFPLALPPPLS